MISRDGSMPWMLAGIALVAALLCDLEPVRATPGQQTAQPTARRVVALHEVANEPVLSPDGRWIAFGMLEDSVSDDAAWSIWVVPSSGGEPVRLTGPQRTDKFPKWFPDSRRLVFASARNENGEFELYPWTVRIDPSTGEPTEPRQLGIEPLAPPANVMDVSPDGRRLAYAHQDHDGAATELRVIPVEGGRSGTVVGVEGRVLQVKWKEDADSLVYVQRTPDGTHIVSQVSSAGGPAEVHWTGSRPVRIASGGRSLLRRSAGTGLDGRADWSHVRLDDQVELARTAFPINHQIDELGANGEVTTVLWEGHAPLSIRSLTGGPPRRLIDDGDYHRVWDWSPDGEQILVYSDTEGLVSVSRATGESRALPRDARARFSATSGRILVYGHGEFRRLVRLDLASGAEVVLTDSFPIIHEYSSDLVGRGGFELRDGPRDVFLTARNGTDSVLVVATEGTRFDTLRVLSRSELAGPVAVFDSIVTHASVTPAGPVIRAYGLDQSPQPVELSLPNDYVVQDMAWSHDGNSLAIVSSTDRALAVRFAHRSGTSLRLGAERRIEANDTLGALWRFDHSGIVMLSMGLEGKYDTSLLFIPASPAEPLVDITADEEGAIYYHSVSPVADDVVYMTERSMGSSIWLFNSLEPSQ